MRALLLLPFALIAALAPAQTAAPFAEVAARDFRAWDANRDGVISEEEVDRAALDPQYHGEDAAALAALHVYLANAKAPASLTRVWFNAYRSDARAMPKGDTPAETKRLKKAFLGTPESLQVTYALDLRRLRRGTVAKDLYADARPEVSDIRQGALGDCYMLAPLGALVHRDPDAVGRMLRPQGDGGVAVAFGDGKTVRVAPPTDAEIAMGGSSTASGLWVRVVEKAFGTRDAAEGAAAIAQDKMGGGSPAKAGRGLTGHPFKGIRLVGGYERPVSSVDLEARLSEVRGNLMAALADHRLVLADTTREAMPPSINGGHAYAVFGYDATTDTITLWNPHGTDFRPKGPDGFENGFARKGGVFSMPLVAFARTFSRIYFESAG